MAGAVAMAAVVEDFEATQPCKKLRKDDDPLPTRTIRNYFVPLPKAVEKPFSPPRTNNIMDYFMKTSPQEKIVSSQKQSPLQSTESVSCQEAKLGRTQRQKRFKKPREQNKLQEEEQGVLPENCAALGSPGESLIKDSSNCSVLGSDTAALLSQISNDTGLDEESVKKENNTESCATDRKVKDLLQIRKSKKVNNQSRADDNLDNDKRSPGEEEGRNIKSVVHKSRRARISQSDSCAEQDKSLHDASLEVNVDENSLLNSSTITVSFEDFLQSQGEEDTADTEPSTCAAEILSDAKSCNDVSDLVVATPQVSPRILTVQAEVHPLSPNHETSKSPEVKVASIFSRRSQVKDSKTSSSANSQVTADILPDLKRKSNVVLQEKDLELAVVESSSTSKCTQEERKQFMNAFKQPSLDGSKGKTTKSSGKLKHIQEKAPETEEKEPDEKAVENQLDETSSEQNCAISVGNKRCRKARKKRQTDASEEVPTPAPTHEELPTSVEVITESGSVDDGKTQPAKEVRRSTRESTRRQAAPVSERNTSPRKTRSQEKAEKCSVSQDDPALACTPKSLRSKKSVYRAEMLSPSYKKGSPIRMKFTRVFPSSATKAGDFEISSPVSVLESNSLKKRKRAKKLVQKAKALQQSKQTVAGEQSTVRRSTRRKECVKMNYCEDEDSVVFVEDLISSPAPASQETGQSQKKLRSLNDVLGKNTPPNKSSKNASASKLAPMFLERKGQKPIAVISIFDDSSCDGSENSQDDEQFRAKREFLKSGLPESFKKQIAKTAANREAYTQACASFQLVVHVQQRSIECSMWTIPWPETSFLNCLKEFYQFPLMPQVSLTGIAGCMTVPAQRACREKVSGWRNNFTESIRQHLLEEIIASNPSFPVQRYFTQFLKRHKDYLLQDAAAEPECGSKTQCPAGSTKSVGGKRKRVDEAERSSKLAKKQKSSHKEEEPIVISESPSSESGAAPETTDSVASSRGQRRRSLRNKQTVAEAKPAELSTPKSIQCDTVIILDSPSSETACTEDGVKEDVLWPEKYQPQHSNDIIGNTASVRKLHSWLKEWKLRADREERRKQQEKKQEEDSNDSWLGDCEELEEAEDLLCNTLLITGPTGVGKTAAVYACAQELGFKVFEVNCSSQRSGRQILSQLKEATQSHQVDIQGVNAHKPTYFNSYSSSGSTAKPGSSPRKVNSPRRVMSSPRKPPQSPRGAMRKGGLAPTSLANFFKVGGRPKGRDAGNQDKKAQTVCSKKSAKVIESGYKAQEPMTSPPDAKPRTEEQGKRMATSLILFEEVDVIFDDDSGFLTAIKTFITTTKRPIILTTSDPTFGAMFDGSFDEIRFEAPSVVNLASYLQLLCLAENVRTDTQDLTSLLHWNRCDVRQSLLHLQFWACSGGGLRMQHPILSRTSECEVKRETVKVENVPVDEPLPPCHTGCTESLLGLLNIQQDRRVEDLLRCKPTVVESKSCWGLLSETERRGMDLFYSNMEVLLPLPVSALPEPTPIPRSVTNPEPQPGLLARHGREAQKEEHADDMSPLKVSSRMRRKKQLCLDDKSVFQSDSESEDGFLSLPKPSSGPVGNPDTKRTQDEAAQKAPSSVRMRRVELSEAERKRSKPVSQCLSSVAEYLDQMSFLDSSLHYQPPQTEGACRPHAFHCTGAEIKSGMSDEVRLESGGHMSGFHLEEINAVIQSLSFWKCRSEVSEAWHKVQGLEEEVRSEAIEELTLPVASHRQSFSLARSTPCEPRVIEMRKELLSAVLACRSFSTLGNRVAATVDYMPSLRTICRSERLKEQGKVKRRFMHYLDGIHLDLPKSIIELLASKFP
ncbi:ATPase family AAA domain-containing protein 5 isoform X1 [Pygocentrus nattereri]|uniref:ATPase family AAA domain-containing protein 5 isoform X1 n=1 Tax=Pygocentrus nattereri TaxID=42514 RepID=UPI00081499A9|nr:ATPase family AAA domain-containing protein 5 isoform X1 [Pygocentrus nattereri]